MKNNISKLSTMLSSFLPKWDGFETFLAFAVTMAFFHDYQKRNDSSPIDLIEDNESNVEE